MRVAMVGLVMGAMAFAATAPGFAASAPGFAPIAKHEKLKVDIKNAAGENVGSAAFDQEKDGKLKVTVTLHNLPAGAHGVHIHEHAVCMAPDFKSAGGHFNPTMKMHGFENEQGHHAGDLPKNVTVVTMGTDVKETFTIDYLTMGTGAPNDILGNGGTSIVVHEKADDMKTDPSGNSGARIACGVITR